MELSEQFAIDLLTETKVAVMPGEAFGVENHIRISFAVSDDELSEGLGRIRKAI